MTFNRSLILIAFSLCLSGIFALFFAAKRQYPAKETAGDLESRAVAAPDPVPNAAHDYKGLLAKVESERLALASRYQHASLAQKEDIEARARTLVTKSIYTEIFPSWYGTQWDFNGTTQIPGQGKIACGYFVSTVLRDAGWRVQRTRLAQQASENIILSLTTEPYVKRFRLVTINDFVLAVKNWGTGIYVVGLDIHTGFIVNTGSEVYFIHSSYVEPYAVVREKANESTILAASKYRVLGRVTADNVFIRRWLLGTEILTRTA